MMVELISIIDTLRWDDVYRDDRDIDNIELTEENAKPIITAMGNAIIGIAASTLGCMIFRDIRSGIYSPQCVNLFREACRRYHIYLVRED